MKHRVVVGIICFVFGLVMFFIAPMLYNAAITEQTEIVRVTKEIRRGDRITGDMVSVVKVGGYNLPNSVAHSRDSVIGKYAKYDMLVDDYILVGKLSDNPLAEFAYLHDLGETYLAMSISIKSFATGLSGKLEADDIVRILAAEEDGLVSSPPELQYVKVLAITDADGNDKDESGNREDENLPATVTLLVNSEQALILTKLEAYQGIHIALVHRGAASTANRYLDTQNNYFVERDLAAEMMEDEESELGENENENVDEQEDETVEGADGD